MSTAAARKCRAVVVNTARVLACELLCAAQGLEFLRPLRPGSGAETAYRHIREHVRPLARLRQAELHQGAIHNSQRYTRQRRFVGR